MSDTTGRVRGKRGGKLFLIQTPLTTKKLYIVKSSQITQNSKSQIPQTSKYQTQHHKSQTSQNAQIKSNSAVQKSMNCYKKCPPRASFPEFHLEIRSPRTTQAHNHLRYRAVWFITLASLSTLVSHGAYKVQTGSSLIGSGC